MQSVLQLRVAVSVALCCSVFCSVLQRVTVSPECLLQQPLQFRGGRKSALQCVAVSMMQCKLQSVLQCVAVSVAECCSVRCSVL